MTKVDEVVCWPHLAVNMRYALPLCITFSVAVHLLLLTVHLVPAPPLQARLATTGASGTLHIRMISNTSTIASATTASKRLPMIMATAVPSESPVTGHHSDSSPTPLSEFAPTIAVAASSDLGLKAASGLEAPTSTAPWNGAEHDDYVPRPLLSIPPVAQMPVLIAVPLGETELVRRTGILSLFIDDEGLVQHITANAPFLPSAFEQAARDAFMAVRFTPGQIDGQAVKSRVRVEVVFDNTPLTGL